MSGVVLGGPRVITRPSPAAGGKGRRTARQACRALGHCLRGLIESSERNVGQPSEQSIKDFTRRTGLVRRELDALLRKHGLDEELFSAFVALCWVKYPNLDAHGSRTEFQAELEGLLRDFAAEPDP